jgi:hypothetical protein
LHREFSKKEVQVASKYMKHSTSLAIKEMQIKTILDFSPVRTANFKNKNKCIGWGETGTIYTVGRNAN